MSTSAQPATAQHVVDCPQTRRRRRRGLLLMILGAGGVGLLSTGAFATWQATSNATSGTLSAASAAATLLDANGGTFNTGVANLVPGDYFYRYVDIQNTAASSGIFTGTVSATGDLAGQLAVEAVTCTLPWQVVASASICPTGATTTIIGSGTPTTTTPVTTANGSILAGLSNAQHVRYKFTFSPTAPDTLMGKTATIAIGVSSALVGFNDRTNG